MLAMSPWSTFKSLAWSITSSVTGRRASVPKLYMYYVFGSLVIAVNFPTQSNIFLISELPNFSILILSLAFLLHLFSVYAYIQVFIC